MAATSSSTKETPNEFLVPGLENSSDIYAYQGQPISIFVKGLELFASLTGNDVSLKGKSGDAIRVTLIGAQPGRLFGLSQQFMDRTPAAIGSASRSGGYAFSDMSHFRSLMDAYGKDSVSPLEPYTVLQVVVPERPAQ